MMIQLSERWNGEVRIPYDVPQQIETAGNIDLEPRDVHRMMWFRLLFQQQSVSHTVRYTM
jgi:hypothetical protein